VIILFININDLKINYMVSGKGKNVILLHGWGANINTFLPVFNNLIMKFKVYSIDLPGFGESDPPHEPWNVEKYADLVERFIEELNIDNPILMGHSFGGRISLFIASRRKVNKVILVDSAGIKPKRHLKYYIKVYSYKLLKNIFKLPILRIYSDRVINYFKARAGSKDYNNVKGVMQKTLVLVVNEDLKYLMPAIKAPTLLVWGEKDTATPVSDAHVMSRLIKDSGVVVLKNAGHYSYLDKLNEFLIVVNEFLKNDVEGNCE
jgi:pimeloyl-ACP methyl ester carboxylesterase